MALRNKKYEIVLSYKHIKENEQWNIELLQVKQSRQKLLTCTTILKF